MHESVMNEYTTQLSVGAATEWVLTFPTKSFYVYEEESGSAVALAPFTEEWDGTGACEVVVLNTIWDREELTIVNPDPEGGEIPPIVSPAPPGIIDPVNPIIPFELCYETSVIRFTSFGEIKPSKTPILGSSNFHTIDNGLIGFEYGWVRLGMDDFPHDENMNGLIDPIEEALSRDPLGGLEGLPITGFSVNRFINGFVDVGTLANYGGIFGHKFTRKLDSTAAMPTQ
jgi:hypothetical protein